MAKMKMSDRVGREDTKKNWYLLYTTNEPKDILEGYVYTKEEAKAYIRDRNSAYYVKIPREDFVNMDIRVDRAMSLTDKEGNISVLPEEEFVDYETTLSVSMDTWMHAIQNILETLPAFDFPKSLMGECMGMLKSLDAIYKYVYEFGGDIYDAFDITELVELNILYNHYDFDGPKLYDKKIKDLCKSISKSKRERLWEK